MCSASSADSVAALKQRGWLKERFGELNPQVALAASLGAVIAFILAITIPYAGQPLHIDDAIFWDFARTNLEHPFQLHIPDYQLLGRDVPVFRDTHPPVVQLYLAAIMGLTGSESEAVLHVGFIIFPLVAGVSMFFLARRFTKNPLLASLMLLATPAMMTMSHSLMGDLPMTSFWLASTAAYIYGVDRNDWRLLWFSGILAVMAVLTGYQALALIPLLPFYALLHRKLSVKTALPLLLPALAFTGYAIYSVWHYGAMPRFSHAQGLSLGKKRVLGRFQGVLTKMGGTSIFPLIMIGVFALRRKRYLALPLIVFGALILGFRYYRNGVFPPASAALFIVFFAAAAMVIFFVLSECAVQMTNMCRRRSADADFLFLGGWLLLMMAGVALLLPHASAKYYLPFLPPLVLLFFRELRAGARSRRVVEATAVAAFAFTLITGTLVAAADYRFARTSRDFALNFSERFSTDGNVWFVGEWGFRHYMETQGYRYLTATDDSPREGDLIVRTEFTYWTLAPAVGERLQLIDTINTGWEVPLGVMNYKARAGFYGSAWGELPWTLTDGAVQRFDVFRVGP